MGAVVEDDIVEAKAEVASEEIKEEVKEMEASLDVVEVPEEPVGEVEPEPEIEPDEAALAEAEAEVLVTPEIQGEEK